MTDLTGGIPASRPAFSPILSDDHAGNLWIMTILAVFYSLLTAAVRAQVKKRVFGVDDALFYLAMVFLLAQSALVFVALQHGLGKSNTITTTLQWHTAGKNFLSSEVLCVVVLSLAKCSIVALMFRLFAVNRGRTWIACWILVILCALWGVASVVGLVVHCDSANILTTLGMTHCHGHYTRWLAITSVDIITEAAIVLLPVIVLVRLNMSVGSKLQVIVSFSFRLPLVAFSVFHLVYSRHLAGSKEPLLTVTNEVMLQQALLTWSLVSATVPNTKPFIESLGMNMGFGKTAHGTRLASAVTNDFVLQTIGSMPHRRARMYAGSQVPHDGLLTLDSRDDQIHTETFISGGNRNIARLADDNAGSVNGSEDMIIRNDVQWEISHGDRL